MKTRLYRSAVRGVFCFLLLLFALLFTQLPVAAAQSRQGTVGAASLSSPNVARIDAFVSSEMQAQRIPGLSLGIVQGFVREQDARRDGLALQLLLGTFPVQLGELLHTAVDSGHLPGFFVALLQGLVVPNTVLFGSLIEWGETLAGLGLMTVGLLALLRPLARRYLGETPGAVFLLGAKLFERLAPLTATGAGLLGLSYFLLDGAPVPWFVPGIAFGGAVNAGLFLAEASVILIVSQFVQWRHSG